METWKPHSKTFRWASIWFILSIYHAYPLALAADMHSETKSTTASNSPIQRLDSFMEQLTTNSTAAQWNQWYLNCITNKRAGGDILTEQELERAPKATVRPPTMAFAGQTNSPFIHLIWIEGQMQYGLFVGNPSFIAPKVYPLQKLWKPGIYAWHNERPPIPGYIETISIVRSNLAKSSQWEDLVGWAYENFRRASVLDEPTIPTKLLDVPAKLLPGPNLSARANLNRRSNDVLALISNGSGQGWYGIAVGPPSYVPRKDEFGYYEEFRPGIYLWHTTH